MFGRCPLYPQKRTLLCGPSTSAKCQKRTFALSNVVGLVCSVRKPSFSQAFRILGEMVRSTQRKHFAQVGDTQRRSEFTQVYHCFTRFAQMTGERMAGSQNAGGSCKVGLLA